MIFNPCLYSLLFWFKNRWKLIYSSNLKSSRIQTGCKLGFKIMFLSQTEVRKVKWLSFSACIKLSLNSQPWCCMTQNKMSFSSSLNLCKDLVRMDIVRTWKTDFSRILNNISKLLRVGLLDIDWKNWIHANKYCFNSLM